MFWQALREHRVVAQRCTACGKLRLYPRPMCDNCYAFAHDWVSLTGEGEIISWSISHHAFNPAFKRDVPYLTVTVEMDEGVRLHAPMPGVGTEQIAVGRRVVADFEDVDESYTRLFFKLAQVPDKT